MGTRPPDAVTGTRSEAQLVPFENTLPALTPEAAAKFDEFIGELSKPQFGVATQLSHQGTFLGVSRHEGSGFTNDVQLNVDIFSGGTGHHLFTVPLGASEFPQSIAFSKNEKLFALASMGLNSLTEGPTIRIYKIFGDHVELQGLIHVGEDFGAIEKIAFLGNSKITAVCRNYQKIKTWNLPKHSRLSGHS
jgi:hypothetical protein